MAPAVQIQLASDSYSDHYTCSQYWGNWGSFGESEWADFYNDWNLRNPTLAAQLCTGSACNCLGYNGPLDVPQSGVQVTCNSTGTAYVYKTCALEHQQDLCAREV